MQQTNAPILCICPAKPQMHFGTLEVKEQTREWIVTDQHLREVMRRLLDSILKGLAKSTNALSNVKCFPTYVQDLPDGTETGQFLALDLGGTNFRVLLVTLGCNYCDLKSKIYNIPPEFMVESGNDLMDHIAECLSIFLKEQEIETETLPLGFTFSFPLKQTGLNSGILSKWTKGFNCTDTVGYDVVKMLEEAIQRHGDINISVYAILNDTTGTLMSCAWKNPACRIGLIIGTGTNACYIEKQKNCELFDDIDLGSGNVIINTEWGAFGENGALDFVRNEYDRIIDKKSINPGSQIFEKMISGMYLGELVRLTIEKLTKQGLMFAGKGSEALFTPNNFETKYVSDIESDPPGKHVQCKRILEELNITHYTEDDLCNVRYVCEIVSKRAAYLVSAGLAVLLNKMNQPFVTIGIDGTLYRCHPRFHDLMTDKIKELIKPGLQFDLMLSEDGSGRGAALVAAVAAKRTLVNEINN